MVRCIHQYDARHPDGITTYGSGISSNTFRRYGCNGESIACLPVYERNGQRGTSEACAPKLAYPPTKASGPRETTRLACATSSGRCFIMVQTRPNQTTVLNRTTIPNRPTMPNQTTTPPMDAPFSPVLHSVTKQYYRQLSKEEAIAFGVISRAVCKQERRILP